MKDIKVVAKKLSSQGINLDIEQIDVLKKNLLNLTQHINLKDSFLAINRLVTYIFGVQ